MRALERGAVALTDGSTRFSVWAPKSRLVEVVLTRDGRAESHPLLAGPDGVHRGTVRLVPAFSDYPYRLDGGPYRPAPVSRWLTPSVEDSGETIRGRGELVSYGRSDLRALLIQSAQNALQQKNSPAQLKK